MSEHQLFCKGLRDLHNWVSDTSHMMQSYCAPTADRSVLDSRMIKLEVRRSQVCVGVSVSVGMKRIGKAW